MPNPFAQSKTFHRLGNLGFTWLWKIASAPRGIAVVTTRGRKSGLPRTRAMRAVHDGDRVYAAAILGGRADWLANLRADPRVRIKLGGRTYAATARTLTDQEERAAARRIYVPVSGFYDYFDYVTFVWGIPTRSNLLRVHEQWFDDGVPVVFELDISGPAVR
jgi:deazaflavin-dependent oxidoreductase (nitroreductase family)